MGKRHVRSGELIEQLEERRLMAATVDVRLVGGGQTATVNTVGQQIDFEVWVNVTGANASGSDEGLQIAIGSLLSSNIGGGAALVVQQRDLSAETLADWLRSQTRESLAEMAERSRSLAKPDATEQVAQICATVAGSISGASPEGKQ